MKTFRQKANEFPPTLCRAVARTKRGRRAMTHAEIALVSGLERSTVAKLSKKTSWDNVKLDTIERFSSACGVNLLHTRRHLDFLRRRKKSYMVQSKFHGELLVRTKNSRSML